MTSRFARTLGIPCLCLMAATPGFAASPPARDALTENAATQWDWDLVNPWEFESWITDDSTRVKAGTRSLQYQTEGAFDTWLWAPVNRDAGWDFTSVSRFRFWVYAVNNNLGFQDLSPRIRLGKDAENYAEFHPPHDLLNDARNQWLEIEVPMAGDSFWTRTDVGSNGLNANSNGVVVVNYIEIHSDTWDAGFTLWFDDLSFETTPVPVDKLTAIAGNAKVSLQWLPYPAYTSFDHFAVYRSTSAFSSVNGLTPIATISDPGATTYVDSAAVNGTHYHYAVTVVATGGDEEKSVASIGPRTPRNETDLHVLYIERTPRYPRYAPIYTGYDITEPSGYGPYYITAATGLGEGQTGGEQRFPSIGQTVTYTVHIRNRGTNTIAGPVAGTWRYDGSVIGTASIPGPLAPGASGTASVTRVWDGQMHDLTFTIDTPDARPENSTLTIDTNAVGFLSYFDRSYEEHHREDSANYPQATSDDFAHWLHLHMQEMNEMFEAAGSDKRVRFDRLEPLGDYDADPSVDTIYWAVFPFRYRAGEGTLRHSGYYHPDVDIDYGLLHEKGHQLGLIDIYQLDVSGDDNDVSGQGYSGVPGLMHGCSPFFSLNSALAMNHWYDKAHGYFGQYIYSTPDQVRMRFIGVDGQPLADATVKMYQLNIIPNVGKRISSQIKAQGVTDANGEWLLPNVPIDTGMVPTTYAGDTLKPNPFGYLAVVGWNGLLHFRIEKDGGVDYAWLDILEVNNAYWQGQTDVATFERDVAVGGAPQFIPPADMTELNVYDWTAWAQGANASVYDETAAGLHPVGAGSIRFETDGGFDTSMRYPATVTARWDLTRSTTLNVRFRSVNNNSPTFQNGSPWIRLLDSENNYFQYQYYSGSSPLDKLAETLNTWRTYAIPLNAPAPPTNGWGRTVSGSPDLANIQYIEIHADTWGAGFTLWVDGLSFTPRPFCHGDGNRDSRIDLHDFAQLQECFGVGGSLGGTVCEIYDFTGDDAVTVDDYAGFAAAITGPDTPLEECQ